MIGYRKSAAYRRDIAAAVQCAKPELLHYEMSYEEVRASGRFTDRGDHAARPNPICRNGSFHVKTTRNALAVTCPACNARLDDKTGR